MDNVGWAWWLLMSIGMVAFWGLLIYAVFVLVRGPRPEEQSGRLETPETLLKRRLASGEISVEEYEEHREALAAPRGAEAGVG